MSCTQFTTTELENEEWRAIPDYEGRYEVSSLGRVRGLTEYKRYHAGRILSPKIGKHYPMIVLRDQSQRKQSHNIHRLVMLAFAGKDSRTVNHKNGIKTDNRLTNLEYATSSEQTRHAYETGLLVASHGERHWNSKLTSEQVNEIRMLKHSGLTRREIGKRFDVCMDHVSRIWRGVQRKSG